MPHAPSGDAGLGASIYECGLPDDKAKHVVENDDRSVIVGVIANKKRKYGITLILIFTAIGINLFILLLFFLQFLESKNYLTPLALSFWLVYIIVQRIHDIKKTIRHRQIIKLNIFGIIFPEEIETLIMWDNIKYISVLQTTKKEVGLVIYPIKPMEFRLLKLLRDERIQLHPKIPLYSPLSPWKIRDLIEHYRAERIDQN